MRASLFGFMIAGLLLCPMSTRAADLTPEKMMSFADHLFDQGDYYRAITEYERVTFFYPAHPLTKKAEFQIAMAYFKGEKYGQALQRFRAVANSYAAEEIGRRALFMVGETYYYKKEYGQAIDSFENFLARYPDDRQADAARIKMGWSSLRQGDWRQASNEFAKLPAGSPLRSQSEGLAKDSLSYPDIPRKSPYLAGGLSAVLPGAGQLYLGRPSDAAISFVLNGLFIWATVEAFDNGNDVTGGVLLFFESGWYLGNVYNAASGAHKYNRRQEQHFLDEMEGQYNISLRTHERDGGIIALTVRF